MPRKPIPEHLLTEKQKKARQHRVKYQKYFQKYSKYYYLKKLLANPNYQQKNKHKKKSKIKPT